MQYLSLGIQLTTKQYVVVAKVFTPLHLQDLSPASSAWVVMFKVQELCRKQAQKGLCDG